MLRRFFASNASAYQMQVSCLIHRNPICIKPMDSFETAYSDYRLALQFEQSRGLLRVLPAGQAPSEQDQAAAKATSPEAQIAALCKNVEPFNAKQHLHQHEAFYGQQTGVKRELYRKIYLLVKDEMGQWSLPSLACSPSEALHVQAQSLAQSICGAEARLYVPGRAPIAYHCQKWVDREKAPFGAKQFFWRAELYAGVFEPKQEHAWVVKEEMAMRLSPSLYESIRHCLSE